MPKLCDPPLSPHHRSAFLSLVAWTTEPSASTTSNDVTWLHVQPSRGPKYEMPPPSVSPPTPTPDTRPPATLRPRGSSFSYTASHVAPPPRDMVDGDAAGGAVGVGKPRVAPAADSELAGLAAVRGGERLHDGRDVGDGLRGHEARGVDGGGLGAKIRRDGRIVAGAARQENFVFAEKGDQDLALRGTQNYVGSSRARMIGGERAHTYFAKTLMTALSR
ncbi:hypothetical protein ANO14919_026350 [Xylariales sp. No.14919]|nr:hypothetical protein ANO14919_026350 [Xylariales sp. No.14919]